MPADVRPAAGTSTWPAAVNVLVPVTVDPASVAVTSAVAVVQVTSTVPADRDAAARPAGRRIGAAGRGALERERSLGSGDRSGRRRAEHDQQAGDDQRGGRGADQDPAQRAAGTASAAAATAPPAASAPRTAGRRRPRPPADVERMPSMPVSSDSCTDPGRAIADRSSAGLLPDGQPAGLVGGAQRAHHQAGGDQHQHHAGDPEEPGQVELDAAAVDQVAERDGDARCPAPRRSRPAAGTARTGTRQAGRRRSRSPPG